MGSKSNRFARALGMALGWGAVTGAAHAVDELQLALAEQDFFAELPVILTATRLPQPVADVPAAVTVIDRQMIEAAGVEDIPSLFRLVAGFQVAHDRDARTSVTYHGASDAFARRMQVLVDGRSIYTPITGGVDWMDLPVSLADIARIEVTRGPNGVAYGANSFLGVINIITFHPADVQGFSFKSTLGDDDYRKGTLRYGGNSGALDYRVTVEHRQDSGSRDFDWDGNGVHTNYDAQRTTALTLRGDYRATVNDYLTFQLGHSEGPRERGRDDQAENPHRWQESQGNFQQLSWKSILSSTEEVSLQFYRSYQKHTDEYLLLGFPVEINLPPVVTVPLDIDVNNSIETERYNLEFAHTFAPAADWRVVWGAEARLDRGRAEGYLGSPDVFEHTLYRLFANSEWQPTVRWTANVGALVEHNEFNGTRTSPRLALNYKLEEGRYLRASYTEAYRTPALFEEKADYAARLATAALGYPEGTVIRQLYSSDGNLKPEHMTSMELAFGAHAAEQRFSYEIKLFHEESRDLIGLYQDGTAYKFTNDGHNTITGFELQARLEPTDSSLISIAYSHANASGRIAGEGDLSTATPENTLSLLLANSFPGNWRASLGLYHVTDVEWIGGDTTSYTTADFTLRKQLRGIGAEGAVFFTVRDFLGEYFDYTNDVFQERRFYFGLELRLP